MRVLRVLQHIAEEYDVGPAELPHQPFGGRAGQALLDRLDAAQRVLDAQVGATIRLSAAGEAAFAEPAKRGGVVRAEA